MYTRRNIRWNIILKFAWWQVLVTFAWASLVTLLYLYLKEQGIDCSMPLAPLGTIGVAVAFLCRFQEQPILRSILGRPKDLGRYRQRQSQLGQSGHDLCFSRKRGFGRHLNPRLSMPREDALIYRHISPG